MTDILSGDARSEILVIKLPRRPHLGMAQILLDYFIVKYPRCVSIILSNTLPTCSKFYRVSQVRSRALMRLSRETGDKVKLCYIVRKKMKSIEPFPIEMMD